MAWYATHFRLPHFISPGQELLDVQLLSFIYVRHFDVESLVVFIFHDTFVSFDELRLQDLCPTIVRRAPAVACQDFSGQAC